MRWATRRHCHVDRAACAWLIRRFRLLTACLAGGRAPSPRRFRKSGGGRGRAEAG